MLRLILKFAVLLFISRSRQTHANQHNLTGGQISPDRHDLSCKSNHNQAIFMTFTSNAINKIIQSHFSSIFFIKNYFLVKSEFQTLKSLKSKLLSAFLINDLQVTRLLTSLDSCIPYNRSSTVQVLESLFEKDRHNS